jgi:hypothetical protein
MHEDQISSSVTVDNYRTPLGDHCDVRHNLRVHLHNERRAGEVPGWDDKAKKIPGAETRPG